MGSDLKFDQGWALASKTVPYLVYRGAVYGSICVALILCLALLGMLGGMLGPLVFGAVFVVAAVTGGLLLAFAMKRSRFLAGLEAGYLALITELITKKPLPGGIQQVTWAQRRVQARFSNSAIVRSLGKHVAGIVRTAHEKLLNAGPIVPRFPAPIAAKLAGSVISHVDEAILAYTFKATHENVFAAAKEGIVLYCQGWPKALGRAVRVTKLGYVWVLVITMLCILPLSFIGFLFDASSVHVALLTTALVAGLAVKWIVFDPIARAASVREFLGECKSPQPDPEWETRIDAVSEEFHRLRVRAVKLAKHARRRQAEDPGSAAPA